MWEPSHAEEELDDDVVHQGFTKAEKSFDAGKVVLAVDIGATKLAVGLVDESGVVLAERRVPNPGNVTTAIALQRQLAHEVMAELPADKNLVATGIACGGPLDLANGVVLSPPNLPDWDRIPISAILNAEFDVPTFLMNDATAGALATLKWDNPELADDIVYLTISSGIGCGVILSTKPVLGQNGNATELGHTLMKIDGRMCRCGLRGCAEAYVSGIAIGDRFSEKLATLDKEALSRRGATEADATAVGVANLALRGDPLALQHWEESVAMIRRLLRNALEVYSPDLLVVGGGVTQAPDLLFNPALDVELDGSLLTYQPHKGPIVRRTSFENQSGVLSAAAIAWYQITEQ